MRLDDAEALLAVYGDVETMQHLNSELPSTVDEAREWVQTKIDLFERDDQLSLWTVIHSDSGQIVGDVGLQHEDYGSGPAVGIGGRGNRHFWRQGMGFEAASATIDAGFEQLELAVIGAETRPENRPAQALLSKLGMHEHHLLDRSLYLHKSMPIGATAHQAGTVRFGTDPTASALDVNCKAHDVDNLYVVDTSFFPSIGAVNPSLTAIANALRVGDHLAERLA